MVWNISLVSCGQLSHLCPLPTSCALAAWPLAEQREKQKKPRCCVSTAQQYLKYPCFINTVFVINAKDSAIQAAVKKKNFIPAITSASM